jgi:adenylate cyclase, class 2
LPAPRENEVKLRVARADEARADLTGHGAVRVRPRHFEDNVLFDDAARSLGRRGCALRVRTTDAGGVLTYKGPRTDREGVKTREEWETEVTDPAAARAIVEALGLRPVFRYQKYREVYHWGGVEIVVDETPIGVFLEIEGELPAIHAAAAALGYGPSDYIRESYASLFLAGGGTGDMVFAPA